MSDLLKMLPIYCLSIIASLWFSYFNFQFFFAKIKSGDYVVPYLDHVFERMVPFVLATYIFNAIFCYFPATILVAYSYKISVERFGGLSSALIVSHATGLLASVLFMKLLAGEIPNRNG